MGRACDPKFGKGATTGIKGQPTGSCSPAIWGTTNKLFPFAINDATQNNSSLMLNNFTTSIFSRYVWAIWRRWAGVSLCCLHIAPIFEHLPREAELRWEEYATSDKTTDFYTELSTWSSNPDLGTLQTLLLTGENAPLQINQGNMKNQSGKSNSGLARNLPPLLKFGRRILDFLSCLIGCFVPRKKEDWPFWERSLDGSQFVIIINGLWSLDAESH